MKKKSRILAVDDEEAIAESIAYLLEAPHRTIAVAKDGKEALALAAREKFDLIITDHRMPRAGGLELVRQLRQRKHVGKIVLISAYLSPDHIGAYEEMDVDEIVGKPFNSKELREVHRETRKGNLELLRHQPRMATTNSVSLFVRDRNCKN